MSLKSVILLLLFSFTSLMLVKGQNPTANLKSGFYSNTIQVELAGTLNLDIRFTLDGTDPSITSPIYNNSIIIENRSSNPNTISLIPTNPLTTFDFQNWEPPKANVLKSTILKFAYFNGNELASDIIQKEYFVGPEFNEIQLPIVSLVSDSIGLFGYEEGIYVPGQDYDDNPNVWQPGNYFNEGNEWERVAHFSFYEKQDLKIQQNIEIELHGGGSRIYPCKSLRLTAKKSLDDKYLSFPFFESRDQVQYKKLILRNAGQDFTKKLCADVLMHSLLQQEDIEYQASNPVVVFLNGSYWGIHNLREHYNKHYFESYHQNDIDDIDYFEIAMSYLPKEGESEDYEELIDDLQVLDLSDDEDFNIIAEQIDIDNYIDHQISKVYAGGTDWAGNNERLWRPKGGKWRWIANDYDDAFVKIDKNSFGHATKDDGDNWPNPEWATRLFRGLMTNSRFAVKYKSRLYELLETVYHPDRVISAIDSLIAIYENEMPRQIDRWNYPNNVNEWRQKMEDMKIFARERPHFLRNNFDEYFPDVYINPANILLYPNPVSDYLNIELPLGNGQKQVIIFDTRGVSRSVDLIDDSFRHSIELSVLSPGMYFAQIRDLDGGVVALYKLIKM